MIKRIEILLIQRDYAQGRRTASVKEIRNDFLDALLRVVNGGPPIGLDFVCGDVETGTLRPLDGQRRLTTLFLLHWYVTFRGGALSMIRSGSVSPTPPEPAPDCSANGSSSNRPCRRSTDPRYGFVTNRGSSTYGDATRRSSRCS